MDKMIITKFRGAFNNNNYAIMIIDKCYTNNMLVLHLYNTKFQEDMYVQYAYIIIMACVNSWVFEMSRNTYSGLQM